jgi:hypothetical protein
MYHLPKSIVKHIYEFDPTFHEIYNIVLNEFKFKTRFWRLKWLNRNLDYHSHIYSQNIYKIGDFQSSHKSIIELCYYWNNTFYEKYTTPVQNNTNCTEEFITDNFSKCNEVIFNIKQLSKLKINVTSYYNAK